MIEAILGIGAFAFSLTVPGLLFSFAVFPRRSALPVLERAALAVFFSIAVPAVCLTMLYSFFGLEVSQSNALLLAGVFCIAAAAACLLRMRKARGF